MTVRDRNKRLSELLTLLDKLSRLHGALESAVQAKFVAIKAANLDDLAKASAREQQAIAAIAITEEQRQEVMERLGSDLGLPTGAGRTMSISQLEQRLDEDACFPVKSAAESLRRQIAKTARANRVVGRLCKDVLGHLTSVFAALRPTGTPPTGYAGDGKLIAPVGNNVFEMTG